MRRSAAVVVVVVAAAVAALAGAGLAGLPLAERYLAHRIKTEIAQAGSISVGEVDVELLDRRLILHDVRSVQVAGISAARWEASGLAWPMGEWLHGRSPLAGLRLGDPFRADHLVIDDLRLSLADGQAWKVASIAMDGLDLARFDGDVPLGPTQAVALGARMAGALSLARLEERDVVYTLPGGQGTLRFADLVVEDVDHGKLGVLAFTDIAAAAPLTGETTFSVASFKAKDIDLRRPLEALAEPSWRPGTPIGRIAFGEAGATGFGGAFLESYGLSLGSVALQTTRDGEVRHSTSRIEGFVLAPPSGPQGLQTRIVMSAMGLKELRLSLQCSGTEDRAKGELAVDRCALVGPDLGEFDLSARLVDADANLWRAIDSGDVRSLYGTQAALGAASLTIADNGLLDRSLRALSSVNAQTPDATRANLAREIRRYQPPGVLITDDLTRILDTLARFVEQGGTLTVESRPDPPFVLAKAGTLQAAGADLVGLLGLSARLSK